MARIPMTSGFVLIPEGTYIFRIWDASYDEEFGKIEVKLVNAEGATHTERFSIKNNDDTFNEGAMNAFSYFAKTAMNDFSLEDIDPEELIGHYMKRKSLIRNFLPIKTRTRLSPLQTSETKPRQMVSTLSLLLVR